MTEYRVSDENITKVEAYFVRKSKETGSLRHEATVVEIAEGAQVALATAHRAIKELQKDKVLQVIKPKSRRYKISYIYNREIEDFDHEQTQKSQLEYLLSAVEDFKKENAKLRKEIEQLIVDKRTLESKLVQS